METHKNKSNLMHHGIAKKRESFGVPPIDCVYSTCIYCIDRKQNKLQRDCQIHNTCTTISASMSGAK